MPHVTFTSAGAKLVTVEKFIDNRCLKYSYLLSCIAMSTFALSSFATIIQKYLAIHHAFWMETIMVVGQIGFQWIFMPALLWFDRFRYMTIALSVSMAGSLMLLPLIVYHWYLPVIPIYALGYFAMVVTTMFVLHHRLIETRFFPSHLSLTWILYRALLLVFLIYPRSGH